MRSDDTYRPLQPTVPEVLKESIFYHETILENSAAYCTWELHTDQPLDESFSYLVLPDGCIDIVFDTSRHPRHEGALVMTPGVVAETVELGRGFSYAGVRLLPGAWRANPLDIIGRHAQMETVAGVDMRVVGQNLRAAPQHRRALLYRLVQRLDEAGAIGANAFMRTVLAHGHELSNVDDIIEKTGYSRRQVQRIFKEQVGYSPHDFLKIVRFQRALRGDRSAYADQPHFIREFRRITAMTPGIFYEMFGKAEIFNDTGDSIG